MAENEGRDGIGHTGFSKYDPTNAPVEKYGGNDAEQDGIITESSPQSMMGGGSVERGKSGSM